MHNQFIKEMRKRENEKWRQQKVGKAGLIRDMLEKAYDAIESMILLEDDFETIKFHKDGFMNFNISIAKKIQASYTYWYENIYAPLGGIQFKRHKNTKGCFIVSHILSNNTLNFIAQCKGIDVTYQAIWMRKEKTLVQFNHLGTALREQTFGKIILMIIDDVKNQEQIEEERKEEIEQRSLEIYKLGDGMGFRDYHIGKISPGSNALGYAASQKIRILKSKNDSNLKISTMCPTNPCSEILCDQISVKGIHPAYPSRFKSSSLDKTLESDKNTLQVDFNH